MKNEAEEFESLAYDFIRDFFNEIPLLASNLGLHEYDFMLPEMSKKAMERRIKKMEEEKRKLEEISWEDLPPGLKEDYLLLRSLVGSFLINMRDWASWRCYPLGAELGVLAVYSLIGIEELPKEHVREALKERISQIPKMIEESIRAVEDPRKLWVRYSSMVLSYFPLLLEETKKFWDEELKEIVENCLDKLDGILEKIEKLFDVAKEGYKPMGPDLFEKMLHEEYISKSPEEIKKEGYLEAEKYRRKLQEISSSLGFSSVKEALKEMGKRAPKDPEEAISWFRECLEKAREFCYSKGIVERIPMERVEILETPKFMEISLPFAGYMPSPPFSWKVSGIFFVTKPKSEEMLRHFNYYDILNTVVHEAYPGHHVQLSYLKICRDPLRRILSHISGFFSEGWAHYCEELCLEEGISSDPMYKLKVYHDALWRAVRVYLDVELSTGEISFEEGVKKLSEDAIIPTEGAYSEVLRYTMNPGYQIRYNYEKRKILEISRKAKEILGSRFSLKEFHRMLLEEGNLPIEIMEKVIEEKLREKRE